MKLTESHLRSIIRKELKEMAMVDPKELDYEPVGTDKFDGVRAQIKQALDVISMRNLDRMPKISNAITELEGHLKMALQELEELQASEPFDDGSGLYEAVGRDELKQKLKSYLGSKPSGVSISTLATKFGVSEKEIKGAARSEGLSVQNDKVMFRKPI